MNSGTRELKSIISLRRGEIAAAHRASAESFATSVQLTAAMDQALRTAFQMLIADARENSADDIAVLALGGYGRVELFPASDVDVMVLCASDERKDRAGATAKQFLHILWDAGIDVGHSVRTIGEAIAQYGHAADSWAAMLESRFVCGSEVLTDQFHRALQNKIMASEDNWFVHAVFDDLANRHQHYGNSVKLLEPNIKKSAGGLRDVHVAFWLYRGSDPAHLVRIDPTSTASQQFLRRLNNKGVLDDDEYASAVAALQFLFRVRHEMHYRRDSLHDTLEYTLQLEVAEGLGFGQREELRSVEVFMHEYYLHARNLHRLHWKLTHTFRELLEPLHRPEGTARSLDDGFVLYDDLLTVDRRVQIIEDPVRVFEAFVRSAEHDVDLDSRLQAVIERSAGCITKREHDSPDLAGLFRRILGSKRVSKTLYAMSELGVLGRYIPEFGQLVAFFQHNVYHFYTADEHTLIALASAEKLREEEGVLHEVFRALKRKDVLYMAILLHDIAKPQGVADHEITGVAMAHAILLRLGLEDIFPDVAFLIRHHLIMEQTAFRRNIHDAQTITEFAARFERPEQLDYLYLLTYADLSALNINVWTEWKASIMQDLYGRTSEVLRRELKGVQIEEYQKSRHAAAKVDILARLSAAMPREEVEQHLDGMQSEAYLALFTEDEVRRHIHHSRTDEPVSVMFAHAEGYTDVTIIADDAPFALSKFCAVLSANDANIIDANVFTRNDGVIIDRFRVTDAVTKQRLDQRVCDKVTGDLRRVVAGAVDIGHLFQAHRRKWRRRAKLPVNPTIRVGVEFEDNPRYTIIDVYAPDSVGFLYRVTETMSKLGLDIYFAKIATRVDGIVDAFYTLDRAGQPIVDPEKRATIREQITKTINALTEEQLGTG
jgi:[protein-PII] uridylyltransferase